MNAARRRAQALLLLSFAAWLTTGIRLTAPGGSSAHDVATLASFLLLLLLCLLAQLSLVSRLGSYTAAAAGTVLAAVSTGIVTYGVTQCPGNYTGFTDPCTTQDSAMWALIALISWGLASFAIVGAGSLLQVARRIARRLQQPGRDS